MKPEMSILLTEMVKRGIPETKKSISRDLKSIENSINVNYSRIQSISDKYVDSELSKTEYDELKNNYQSKINELENEKSNIKKDYKIKY